jgi:CRP-like cAMP-binding protein
MFLEYDVITEYTLPLSADKLFDDLTPPTLKAFNKIKRTRIFKKSACFFSRGEIPGGVYILRAGRAQIVCRDEFKVTKTVRSIGRNEIFGLTEIFSDLPFELHAETLTPCICECFGRDEFIKFLHGEPEVCFRLLQVLGANLQKSYKLLLSSIN